MTIEEIEQLVYDYGKDVYKFCYHLTLERDRTDELYQETFLKAVELRHKVDRSGNPKSYLLAIAVNLWKNFSKKEKNRDRLVPKVDLTDMTEAKDESGKDILDEFVKKEMLDTIKALVLKLPEKQKLVMILYYGQNLSTEEIGRILHIPKGTVMSRLSKARENLKKEMEAKGYEV